MIAYILALAPLFAGDEAPKLLKPFADRESCMVLAEKMNRTDEELRTIDARNAGLEYVCLKIERVLI